MIRLSRVESRRAVVQKTSIRAILTAMVTGADSSLRAGVCRSIGQEYPVLSADSVGEVRRMARTAAPDVIVVAVRIPVTPTDECLLRALHAGLPVDSPPVVIVAADAEERGSEPVGEWLRERLGVATSTSVVVHGGERVPEGVRHALAKLIGCNHVRTTALCPYQDDSTDAHDEFMLSLAGGLPITC